MERIWGIYLNNLHYKRVEELYRQAFPRGQSKNKVDRILELVALDQLPNFGAVREHLFAGRTSSHWLRTNLQDTYQHAHEVLRDRPLQCLDNPRLVNLNGTPQIVHGVDFGTKLVVVMGIGDFKSQISVIDYSLHQTKSEYFAYVILRQDAPGWVELRTDSRLLLKLTKTLNSDLSLGIDENRLINPLDEDHYREIKSRLPQARLKKYRGRAVDDQSITELIEYTARQNVDYTSHDQFFALIEDLEDESVTIVFSYGGTEYSLRIGLVTGSILFRSYAPEEVIDFVFQTYREVVGGT